MAIMIAIHHQKRRLCFFAQKNRLKRKRDFDEVYKCGKRLDHNYFRLYYLHADHLTQKTAFIASRKIGNAVVRNRSKRVLRELFRLNQNKITKTAAFVFLAKRRIANEKFEFIQQAYQYALQREHLWLK